MLPGRADRGQKQGGFMHYSNKLLPERAHPGHLKDQARDLMQAHRRNESEALRRIADFHPQPEEVGVKLPLHEALLVVAREYGFVSWPRLKAALELGSESLTALREAIDADDAGRVTVLLEREPALVDQYVTRGENILYYQRPLTYAAQRGRVEIVKLLLEAGADMTADGNMAVARGAMHDARLPILDLFHERGLDVNCQVYYWGPLITYPAECQSPKVLQWLLERGADPNLRLADTKCTMSGWEVLISDYDRTNRFHDCVNIMLAHGAKHEGGPEIDLYRGDFAAFARRVQAEPGLARQRFANIRGANLPLEGATLLHLCAEWNFVEAAETLLPAGADVNARAPVNAEGFGGQTPLFHTVNSIHEWNVPMLEWLLRNGAEVNSRVSVSWVGQEFRDVTPLQYARLAQRHTAQYERVAAILKTYGAEE